MKAPGAVAQELRSRPWRRCAPLVLAAFSTMILAAAPGGCRRRAVHPIEEARTATPAVGGSAQPAGTDRKAAAPAPDRVAPEDEVAPPPDALTIALELLRGLAAVESPQQWRILAARFPGSCPALAVTPAPEGTAATWALLRCALVCPDLTDVEALWRQDSPARRWHRLVARCGADAFGGPALAPLAGPGLLALAHVGKLIEALEQAAPGGASKLAELRRAAAELRMSVGLPAELLLPDGAQEGVAPPAIARLGTSGLPGLIVVVDAAGGTRLLLAPTARIEKGRPLLNGELPFRFPGQRVTAATLGDELGRALETARAIVGAGPPGETDDRGRLRVGLYVDAATPLALLDPLWASLAPLDDIVVVPLASLGERLGPIPTDPLRLRRGRGGRGPYPLVQVGPRAHLRTAAGARPLGTWRDLVAALGTVDVPVALQVP